MFSLENAHDVEQVDVVKNTEDSNEAIDIGEMAETLPGS